MIAQDFQFVLSTFSISPALQISTSESCSPARSADDTWQEGTQNSWPDVVLKLADKYGLWPVLLFAICGFIAFKFLIGMDRFFQHWLDR
jgi:hypothetical protein